MEILPDSRLQVQKGVVRGGYHLIPSTNWVQIFCGNCGTPGGRVPEENMSFVFWLCTPCFQQYGEITNHYCMPDEVFWELVKQEQLDTYGRLLTTKELCMIAESASTPLGKLMNQKRR